MKNKEKEMKEKKENRRNVIISRHFHEKEPK